MTQTTKRTKPKKPPKPVIVELDPEGDAWLKTGKRTRRPLTRDEFMRLAAAGGVVVTRTQ